MDVNTLRIAVTLTGFILFVGIIAWAYARHNRGRFDEASRIPFQND